MFFCLLKCAKLIVYYNLMMYVRMSKGQSNYTKIHSNNLVSVTVPKLVFLCSALSGTELAFFCSTTVSPVL